MSFYRSDSPPPSWYEAPDPIEDDEDQDDDDDDDEPFVISAGVVAWRSIP